MIRTALLVALLAAACGSKPPPVTAPETPSDAIAIDPSGSLEIASEEITFTAGSATVPGTLVRPTSPGKHPALVLMAGSGPTDRDWNNPLLPGKNGSAKLLAEALGKRGVVVLRFDKAGVGANKTSLADQTFDIYRDEGRAALAYLRTRPEVATDKLYVAGHSEGGMHATRVAIAEESGIAGLLLLSTSSRSMIALIMAQLEPQLKAAMPDKADAELASIKQAFTDFLAGKPVDPKQVTQIAPLQQLVQSITNPATASLSRSMVGWDPLPEVGRVTVPILVYNGRRDIQVDADVDGKALHKANPHAELHVAPDADHVLKHETRTVAELRANLMIVQSQMNAESRTLDPATVDAITDWLIAH